MAKKDLNNAVTELLGGAYQEPAKPLKRDARTRRRSGLPIDKNAAGYKAVTISVNTEFYSKMQQIAFNENTTIKKVVEQAMEAAIKKYENAKGEIKVKPIKTAPINGNMFL